MVLWPQKGLLMKTQTRILDNRLYYTRKIELHKKGKVSYWSALCPVRRIHYGKMGKAPATDGFKYSYVTLIIILFQVIIFI